LRETASQIAKEIELLERLDTFRNDLQLEAVGHRDDRSQ